MIFLAHIVAAIAPARTGTARDPTVPGFRHRVHEREYARLGLPFCRRDSLRKLSVLLEEERADGADV